MSLRTTFDDSVFLKQFHYTLPEVGYYLLASLHPILQGAIQVCQNKQVKYLPKICLCGVSLTTRYAMTMPETRIFTIAVRTESFITIV